jgi:cell wall-associated NlpC family hydrolase
MTARTGIPAVLSRLGITSALTAAAVAVPLLTPGLTSEADAATIRSTALKIAASKEGSLYKWGAVGPRKFDCSGLTLYSFKRAGKKLPRTAQQQYNRTKHIRASSRTLGDLVFFHSGSGVYHVGLYAGHGKIWHAPKPGRKVRLEKIWTHSVYYGRVR